MSHTYAKTYWTNAQIKLSHLLGSEFATPKGFDSKREANDYVRRLFVEYNDIMKKLDEIYETIVHPQKRLIIRLLLDGIVGRLVELKQEMIKFDSCEYTYFEDLALDQKKTLDDLALQVPRYIAEDRSKSIEQRNQTIQTILDRINQSKNNNNNEITSSYDNLLTSHNDDIPLATAIRVLQAHERARQGRVHAYFMFRMKQKDKTKTINETNLNESCLIIQTIWRQKYAEKLFHQKKIENAKMLGMILPRRNISTDSKIDERVQKKRDLQLQYEKELDEASSSVKQKIRQYEETEIKSRLEHVLIQWLLESRQLYGQFPIYPSEELNGSATLFKQMTIDEVQEFVNKQAQTLKTKTNKRKEVKKPLKKTEKKSIKQKATINALEPSKFIPILNNQMNIYKENFYERDESHNKSQQYDKLLVIDQFRPEVEDELRYNVDNILRNELIYLKLAIDNIEDKKSKKVKKKKKKKKKKKRKKTTKDLVANRTNDSILEELVETGIILPMKSVDQKDFIGDYQYLTEIIRYNEKESMPSLLDCQQLVILQIIFPLCSQNVHVNLSPHKAVLLAGPRGSGKELLVHIACNQLGGLLLDLSPATLVKSFNTADGLKVLFAMIKRLVLTMPPILCLIRDTELLFSKKLSSQEKEYQPRRLRRVLRKFIKKIKPGQRIMFVGLSSQPYRAQIKPFLQIYKHIILFPRPNYGSRRKMFSEILINKYNINISDVELSILASISNGYTGGQILETIQQVIHQKQGTNSYTSDDFLPILGMKPPVFLDEENKIKNWYAKTPNGKLRLKDLTQTSIESSRKKRI